ncbi:hypothetical protein K450DRAFT_254131 [Umbelopsis ramanniana AG]|uniref:Uncharacterized protein n=1 Tax=Umbelopsis ramanniana AG TaxID=1314678 RepID=A0AAD5HAL1_UMBRA|nr:uncharacterized protein K450DRAFT_254131 [Umbelopsis ramanniana AG]KAI8577052.1 hypothetical protein K450DRAFT_254131 [Umbelopsis ramanniana AG]
MYKILLHTDLQWSAPNGTGNQIGQIERSYKELSDDDKKKYDALVEAAFKEKYLNPKSTKSSKQD